jgi:hypothetical protein
MEAGEKPLSSRVNSAGGMPVCAQCGRTGPPHRSKLAVAERCPPRPIPWRAAPVSPHAATGCGRAPISGPPWNATQLRLSSSRIWEIRAGLTPNIRAAALVVSPAASAKAIFRRRAVNRRSHSAKSIRQAATSAGVARRSSTRTSFQQPRCSSSIRPVRSSRRT